MASECERAKLLVILMQADASTSVAAFHRHFMGFLSDKRSREALSSLSAAGLLILGPMLRSCPGAGDLGRALCVFGCD